MSGGAHLHVDPTLAQAKGRGERQLTGAGAVNPDLRAGRRTRDGELADVRPGRGELLFEGGLVLRDPGVGGRRQRLGQIALRLDEILELELDEPEMGRRSRRARRPIRLFQQG